MANGFFLGGMAEGISDSRRQDLAERTLASDTGLRSRALDLSERQVRNTESQNVIERLDKGISDTMSIVSQTISEGIKGGTPPEKLLQAVSPLVDSAKQLAQRAGRDPASVDAQVRAMVVSPNPIAAATVAGKADAAKTIATDEALRQATPGGEIIPRYKDSKDKTTLENSLRDDFLKQSAPFITQRDAKNRIDSLSDSGAGDVALVFSYMKILDPQSTVRESEFAQVAQAGGLPSMVQAAWNKLQGGGVVADKTRKAIRAEADNIYQAAARQHDKNQTSFSAIAKRQGLNPNNVTIDLQPSKGFSGKTPSGLNFTVR